DMEYVLDEMDKADIIVFASPVYFYTITGQMKTLIDRMTPRYQGFTNKECYFIICGVTADKENLCRAVEDFRGFLDCMPDPVEKGMVLATGVWEEGDVKGTGFTKEAYNLGKSINN
ncbi:MAG: flavodoxin family protein, partial [Methanobrevibacter sp.]